MAHGMLLGWVMQLAPERVSSLGGYRLVDVLGSGGMAVVYLAEHSVLGKRVAIKQLLPRLSRDPNLRERFLQEARIACALDHPSLPNVHDFYSGGDVVYFVMDVIDGPTVADRLDCGQLMRAQALDIGAEIANAVVAAHASGVLHLDIKTENVMLDRRGDREVPVLIDFGVASVTRDACCTTAAADPLPVGTPRCMSPEQASGELVDARTDVWGLGVLLYEMLDPGHEPFGGETVRDMLVEVVASEPRPMSAAIPEPLRALVARCLRKDPAERPATAADVRDAIIRAARDYHAETRAIDDELLELDVDAVISELDEDDELPYESYEAFVSPVAQFGARRLTATETRRSSNAQIYTARAGLSV